MARTDNLNNYLTDVAAAIKEKKGDMDTPIPANTFDDEIRNLPSGGGDIEEYISSTSDQTNNSTYNVSNQIRYRMKKLPDLDLTNIVSNNVFSNLFLGLSVLSAIPVIKLNDSILKLDIQKMCSGCTELIDCSKLIEAVKNKKIINMNHTFEQCSKMTDFSFLSKFDTSELAGLNYAFYYCKGMTEIPLFDTSKVTDMEQCFYNCESLETIPAFNTSKCQNFHLIFFGANALTSLPKLNFSSAIGLSDMLKGNKPNLTDLGGFESLGFSYYDRNQNNIMYTLDLSTCPNLTEQSLINVIDNLYDLNLAYEGDAVTQKLVLGADNMAKLTPEKIAEATAKGWNVS